ncbi:MAG: hypothetical protein ACTSV2_12490, partial [Candidatus Thorarchaeota archaeon]
MYKRKVVLSFIALILIVSVLSVSSCLVTEQGSETAVNETKSTSIENLNPIVSLNHSISDSTPTNLALYFDGSDEVIIPSDSSLNPTTAITVMAWINADDWIGNRRILQKGVDDQ